MSSPKSRVGGIWLAFALYFSVVRVVRCGTLTVQGEVYGGGPSGTQVVLFEDGKGFHSNTWPHGNGTWQSLPTMDVAVMESEAFEAPEGMVGLYPQTIVEWLDAITALAIEATADNPEQAPYLKGVQWSITNWKGPLASPVRLYFLMGPTLQDLTTFRPYEVGDWHWTDKTDFSKWLWSGAILWCDGSTDCGDIDVSVETWGAPFVFTLRARSSCAPDLLEVDPSYGGCDCTALGTDEEEEEMYKHVTCYACVSEGVSSVWNVPDSTCVQPDVDMGPSVLVHAPNTSITSITYGSHAQPGPASAASVLAEIEIDGSGPAGFDLETYGAGTPFVTALAYDACLNAPGGLDACSIVSWSLAWRLVAADPEWPNLGPWTVNMTVVIKGFPAGSTVSYLPTTPRQVPSIDGSAFYNSDTTSPGTAVPYEAFRDAPALLSTSSGVLTLCSPIGPAPGCGPVTWTPSVAGGAQTIVDTIGNNVTAFNPPSASTACLRPVWSSRGVYNAPACACEWQNLSPVAPCGNCTDGRVRSPETPHLCVPCEDAVECNTDNTATHVCVGTYDEYRCECEPGWDTESGCNTCLAGFHAPDWSPGTCLPCATALNCTSWGITAAVCDPSSFYGFRCLCKPGYIGDTCDVCNRNMGLFMAPDGETCVSTTSWCGPWGIPIDGDVAGCTCTHGRTGDRCDTCDGEALCGPGGVCQSDPHEPAWCNCSWSPLDKAWWKADSDRAVCDTCPPEHLPTNWTLGPLGGCSPASEICGGVVNVLGSTLAERCICQDGWFFNETLGGCYDCSPGRVGDGCLACDSVCGGEYWETCAVPRGGNPFSPNAASWCACEDGRAGPPCTGDCLPGTRRRVSDDTCTPCPSGCPDQACSLVDGAYTTCECPDGYTDPECETCAPGWVAKSPGSSVCVPCPSTGCLNGVCVVGGVCECKPGFESPYCQTCSPTHRVVDGACVPCESVTCGDAGRCVSILVSTDAAGQNTTLEEACACNDGYAWTPDTGSCVACDEDTTTGPAGGCVACPPCPPGSGCTFRISPEGVYEAVCACAAGSSRVLVDALPRSPPGTATDNETLAHVCYAGPVPYVLPDNTSSVGARLGSLFYLNGFPVVYEPFLKPSQDPGVLSTVFFVVSMAIVAACIILGATLLWLRHLDVHNQTLRMSIG